MFEKEYKILLGPHVEVDPIVLFHHGASLSVAPPLIDVKADLPHVHHISGLDITRSFGCILNLCLCPTG